MTGWLIERKDKGPYIVHWCFGNSRVQEYVAWSVESAQRFVDESKRNGDYQMLVTE